MSTSAENGMRLTTHSCEVHHALADYLRKVLAPFSLAGLSRFFARVSWSESALGQRWLARFRTQLEPAVQTEHQRQRATRSKRRGHAKAISVIGYLI